MIGSDDISMLERGLVPAISLHCMVDIQSCTLYSKGKSTGIKKKKRDLPLMRIVYIQRHRADLDSVGVIS